MPEELSELFSRAIELEGESRKAFVRDACAGNDSLRAELSSLLEAHDRRLLDEGLEEDRTPRPDREGSEIGPYKLLQKIGEGGFGVVWLADQRHPIRRRVAIKIIKLGMDTEQVIARFEAERQALAMLDHPHIARVLDAGCTDVGRPYFVMEYIRGVPILEYCDKNSVETKERLKLFVDVCRAIQHAHHKGIIHRDIKPSNVLVTMHDGEAVPKVIDFGVAKATGTELTSKTLFTKHQQMVGTPAYMSPEQAEMSDLDIDTRTDVYSLGVLLYELLTGSTPFPLQELMAAGLSEMMRTIRQVDPPKPSTRLTESRERLVHAAAARRIEPKRLGALIRGELDWIVMKAIEKDRRRRYESPGGLAKDVHRFLDGDSVEAAPPSLSYRVRKLVSKNKGAVSAAVLVSLALFAGLIAFAWQKRLAQEERDLAMKERNRAVDAEGRAERKASELQKVSDFQGDMLAQVDPHRAGSRLTEDVLARYEAALKKTGHAEKERQEALASFSQLWATVNATDIALGVIDQSILEPAVRASSEAFDEQPIIQAHLRQVIADRYRQLGLFDEALPLQQEALEARRRLLGDASPQTLQSLTNMGLLIERVGRRSEVEAFWLEALELRRRALGDQHPDTIRSVLALGYLYRTLGWVSKAESYLREGLDLRERVLGSMHRATLSTRVDLGKLLWDRRRLDEAEPLLNRALEGRKEILGEDHTNTILTKAWLGAVWEEQGRKEEGRGLLGDALRQYEKARQEDVNGIRQDFNQAGGLSVRLGALFSDRGEYSRAEPFYRDGLEKRRRVFGEEHQHTLDALSRLGTALVEQERLEEGREVLSEAFEVSRARIGLENEVTRRAMKALGDCLFEQAEYLEAQRLYEQVLELDRALLGGPHHDVASDLEGLARVRHALGEVEVARSLLDEAIAMERGLASEGSRELARFLWRSAAQRLEAKEPSAGLPEIEEAITLAEALLPSSHPHLDQYRRTLALCRESAKGR